nr:MAG TPA: hypothetical protein [Caudoviricetes sp.]
MRRGAAPRCRCRRSQSRRQGRQRPERSREGCRVGRRCLSPSESLWRPQSGTRSRRRSGWSGRRRCCARHASARARRACGLPRRGGPDRARPGRRPDRGRPACRPGARRTPPGSGGSLCSGAEAGRTWGWRSGGLPGR